MDNGRHFPFREEARDQSIPSLDLVYSLFFFYTFQDGKQSAWGRQFVEDANILQGILGGHINIGQIKKMEEKVGRADRYSLQRGSVYSPQLLVGSRAMHPSRLLVILIIERIQVGHTAPTAWVYRRLGLGEVGGGGEGRGEGSDLKPAEGMDNGAQGNSVAQDYDLYHFCG